MTRRTRFVFAALIVSALAALAAQNRTTAPVAPADLVLQGGKIVTVDDTRPVAEALAVRGDTIVAVGPIADINPYIGTATKVIDLKGRTAVPGRKLPSVTVQQPVGAQILITAFPPDRRAFDKLAGQYVDTRIGYLARVWAFQARYTQGEEKAVGEGGRGKGAGKEPKLVTRNEDHQVLLIRLSASSGGKKATLDVGLTLIGASSSA